MTEDMFIEECQFAKIVETKDGAAILIAGIVFNVTSSVEGLGHIDHIVKVLRNRSSGGAQESSTTISTDAA